MMEKNSATVRWIWNPETDQYKEWDGGGMSHPEVANLLWRDRPGWDAITAGNWWGGAHAHGSTQVYWYPASYGTSNEAKRNAPLELLEHFRKRGLNR